MWYIALYAAIGLVALGMLFLFLKFFGLWFRALLSGAPVGMGRLIGMWLRHVKPSVIVDARIMLTKAGIAVESDMLETHFLAGGNVPRVSQALVAANKANIPLTFQRAAAIDLAGRDVLDAVQTSVNPKVIDCPDPTKGKVDASTRWPRTASSSRSRPASRCARTSSGSSAAPPRRRSSPASARAS